MRRIKRQGRVWIDNCLKVALPFGLLLVISMNHSCSFSVDDEDKDTSPDSGHEETIEDSDKKQSGKRQKNEKKKMPSLGLDGLNLNEKIDEQSNNKKNKNEKKEGNTGKRRRGPYYVLGNFQGNGGVGVLCHNGKSVVSVETLDVWEARELRGIKLQLSGAGLDYKEKAAAALLPLETLDPYLYDMLSKWLSEFDQEVKFLNNIEISDTHDTSADYLSDKDAEIKCEDVQIAMQRVSLSSEDPRYAIDKSFWDLMDDENKATLILHEILYREALRLGQRDSEATRLFNSFLFSGLLANLDIGEYEKKRKELGFDRKFVYSSDGYKIGALGSSAHKAESYLIKFDQGYSGYFDVETGAFDRDRCPECGLSCYFSTPGCIGSCFTAEEVDPSKLLRFDGIDGFYRKSMDPVESNEFKWGAYAVIDGVCTSQSDVRVMDLIFEYEGVYGIENRVKGPLSLYDR